jgi:hypothetical protein
VHPASEGWGRVLQEYGAMPGNLPGDVTADLIRGGTLKRGDTRRTPAAPTR